MLNGVTKQCIPLNPFRRAYVTICSVCVIMYRIDLIFCILLTGTELWTASVYRVHVTMFPRDSACVYIVHLVKTDLIRNYFAKPRRSCFEFHVYSL